MPADQQLSSLYSRSSRTCCDQPTDVLRARRFAAFTLRESTKAAGECSHMNPDWRRLGPQNSLMSIHEAPDRSADTNTTARRAYDSFTGPVTLLSIALGAWDAQRSGSQGERGCHSSALGGSRSFRTIKNPRFMTTQGPVSFGRVMQQRSSNSVADLSRSPQLGFSRYAAPQLRHTATSQVTHSDRSLNYATSL